MKKVSHALDDVQKVLQRLSDLDALDEKLAEYAFFPFTHIFNEAQRLSASCLESSVNSLAILASKGWRQHLAPEMGKQLLILMTLVAGADSKRQLEPPSEDLKVAAFHCIDLVVKQLALRTDTKRLFDDVGSKSIVDQLAYLLLESVTEDSSAQVQVAAAEALLTVVSAISNRVLLASLLPRTASSLTQSLHSSTKARRTRKVLIAYLKLLIFMLRSVISDTVVYPLSERPSPPNSHAADTSEALNGSWLQATSAQVNLVIVQVVNLRNHEHSEIRHTVADLCLMIITECTRSLSESVPVAVETITSIAQSEDGASLVKKLENVSISYPEVADILATKLRDWIQSLPRTMQANNEQIKQRQLGQIGVAIEIAAHGSHISEDLLTAFANKILESVTLSDSPERTQQRALLEDDRLDSLLLGSESVSQVEAFSPLIMTHAAQSESLTELGHLLGTLQQTGFGKKVARIVINRIPDLESTEKVSGIWLAMRCLEEGGTDNTHDFLLNLSETQEDITVSRPRLVSELHAAALPCLLDDDSSSTSKDWRLTALAIEVTVLQAKQLEISYRTELMDSLYPMLSLLGSMNTRLRTHAMTGLNLLADACRYASTSDMLIDNVDYLINSVGMKLDSFDVSPQAPQVLLMMLRLCGTRIVPYIDDLVGSMFSALGNFHGYPKLVELLFQVLRVVVEESKKSPQLAVTNGHSARNHEKQMEHPSTVADILEDLQRRKSRKRKQGNADENDVGAPHRPWKTFESEMTDLEGRESEAVEDSAGQQTYQAGKEEGNQKLSKSHQLLLSIAKSVPSHLTSPSPQVRNILLQMLDEVSPLLAQDEDSFLPLINSVWPAVVSRLLDQQDSPSDSETTYNICAAADTIATLCKNSGNFMASRIEDILPQIRKLFEQVRGSNKALRGGAGLATTTDLAVHSALSISAPRSSSGLILAALIRLLASILTHVRLSEDRGDEIVNLLGHFSTRPANQVKEALLTYSSDALWLWSRLYEQ